MWGRLAKVLLPEPKRRKVGPKTVDCMLIGYAGRNAAYRFLVLKIYVLDCNTIFEIKMLNFLNIFFHCVIRFSHASVETENEYTSKLRN